jgi:inositol transport system substrate-binding protein
MVHRVVRVAGVMLAFVLILGACTTGAGSSPSGATGSQPAAGAAVKIGATFPIIDTFLGSVKDGMEAKAKELGNVEITVVSAEEKADAQLGQVENFISQGVDAIIIIPVDTEATQPMTDAAIKANIPLVYVNRRPAGLDKFPQVPYVGSDSLFAGTVEMQELAKLAGGKGNVVILIGDPANEAAVLRTQGCKDQVAANPGMKVTKEQAGNWYRDKGLEIMENWIQTGEQIDVVCANNDEMALGAIKALKDASLLDKVLVGGVDATPDALAAMKAGELEVTVFQDAKGQGGGGVDAAVKLARGETVPSLVDIPYQLVTKDNMDQFMGAN